jgi:hypothetical protein
MITVQELTEWVGNFPNHKYILSDDRRLMYGYVRCGDAYPTLFDPPIGFDASGRKFKVLVRTKDIVDANIKTWTVDGSKGAKYTVTLEGGDYSCGCPAAAFRKGPCKHIQQIAATNR